MSRQDIVSLLITEPIKKWDKVAQRILFLHNLAIQNKMEEYEDMGESFERKNRKKYKKEVRRKPSRRRPYSPKKKRGSRQVVKN